MVTYPKDWDVVELGKKCEVTSSKRVFESEWKNSGIPFLRTRDIASFQSGTDQKDKLFISESTYKEKTAVSGEPVIGDLLVTGVGTIGLPYRHGRYHVVSGVPLWPSILFSTKPTGGGGNSWAGALLRWCHHRLLLLRFQWRLNKAQR